MKGNKHKMIKGTQDMHGSRGMSNSGKPKLMGGAKPGAHGPGMHMHKMGMKGGHKPTTSH